MQTFQKQMTDNGVRVLNDNYVQWRSCETKRRFSVLSDAHALIDRYGRGHVYHCDHCFGFHYSARNEPERVSR